MTETEINQAIAEALGWKFHHLDVGGMADVAILPPGATFDAANVFAFAGIAPPNFYRDLNACKEMREFIKKDPKLIHKYQGNASIVLGKRHAPTYMELMDASAPEHCEIFLRTIGKWKE